MSRSRDGTWLTTRSPMRTTPSEISSSPATIRSAVVFPHPDGPTRTMNSSSVISRSRSRTAVVPSGYVFRTRSNVTSATAPLRPWFGTMASADSACQTGAFAAAPRSPASDRAARARAARHEARRKVWFVLETPPLRRQRDLVSLRGVLRLPDQRLGGDAGAPCRHADEHVRATVEPAFQIAQRGVAEHGRHDPERAAPVPAGRAAE